MFRDNDWIGRSNLKCVLIECEDEMSVSDAPHDEESVRIGLRNVRLFFDAMDQFGLRRVKMKIFNECMSLGWEGEYAEQVCVDDDLLVSEYCNVFEHFEFCHPEYFEDGEPEDGIQCDESCRGTIKVVYEADPGPWMSVAHIQRNVRCLYKEWL